MTDTLRRCLDDFEARLDEAVEAELLAAWQQFAAGEFEGEVFSPRRPAPNLPRVEWPEARVNAALESQTVMALQQFGQASATISGRGGLLPAVRANYGTSIMPLLFGVEPFIMDERMNTLPTSRPLRETAAIEALVAAGRPPLTAGWGERVLATGRYYRDLLADYPKLRRWVHVYHPDLQGPFDICEVIWGSEIFYALYDCPDLLLALLDLVTETYIAFLRAWQEIWPAEGEYACHWGWWHRGQIMLRDDSAMNLSPEQFDVFGAPFEQRLLTACGGGAMHFCGRGEHFIDRLPALDGLHAVNLSQPHLNDMDRIFDHTIDRGLLLLALARPTVDTALATGRNLRGRVHSA